MDTDKVKIEELKRIQTDFREKFSILKKAKVSLLNLFRQKLEQKKIEEIKQEILTK